MIFRRDLGLPSVFVRRAGIARLRSSGRKLESLGYKSVGNRGVFAWAFPPSYRRKTTPSQGNPTIDSLKFVKLIVYARYG